MQRTGGDVTFEVMDVTNMQNVSSGSCDVVLDKGTLDALASTDSDSVRSNVEKMLAEIARCCHHL